MDKATRDALPADLLGRAEVYALPIYVAHERLGIKDLVLFALSEADRRESMIAEAAKTIAWGDSVILHGGYAVVPETWLREAADRRERECIERASKMWCIWCDADSVPATRHENPSPARWFHDMEDHGLKECEADEIREWSYQREQRRKW